MSREQEIRDMILLHPKILTNKVSSRDKRVPRLRGTNMSTPYFACYVQDEEGDVAEITFDIHMEPLSSDPIYGVTYARQADGSTNPKDGACHSIDDLVTKLFWRES